METENFSLGLQVDNKDILSNRQKSKIAKRFKAWCYKCDAYLVSNFKCENCGNISNRKKNEKET